MTNIAIFGLTTYTLGMVFIFAPRWRRYVQRIKRTLSVTQSIRRERIRELDAMHAHREAVRIGWHNTPTTSKASTGGWL